MSKYIYLPHDCIGKYRYNDPVLSADELDKVLTDLSGNIISKKEGNSGEVIYRTGNDTYVNRRILDDKVLVCQTQIDLDDTMMVSSYVDFSDVFANWQQFGNHAGKQYPKDADTYNYTGSGVNAWTMSQDGKRCVQPLNTEDVCGYISPFTVNDYQMLVKCSSTNADNDFIGVVAGAVADSNGIIHTISFVRNCQLDQAAKNHHWFCILDQADSFDVTSTYNGQVLLADGVLNVDTEGGFGWSQTGGTLISIVRRGNTFSAQTTPFYVGDDEPKESDLTDALTIDIDDLAERMPEHADVLNLFKRKQLMFGFCTYSQPQATYDVLKLKLYKALPEDECIVDLLNDRVMKYDAQQGYYTIDKTVWDVANDGVFLHNKYIGKTYYAINTADVKRLDYIANNIANSEDGTGIIFNLKTYAGLVQAIKTLLMYIGFTDKQIIA